MLNAVDVVSTLQSFNPKNPNSEKKTLNAVALYD